jgi:alpha-N-acetylglucosamine transferase
MKEDRALRRTLFQLLIITSTLLIVSHIYLSAVESTYSYLSPFISPSLGDEKVAYATLLLPPPTTNSTSNDPEDDEDVYFLSIRMLNYQLLHSLSPKTKFSIPFLVLVTPEVDTWKTDQLAREGATIVPIKRIPQPKWVTPLTERWEDVMAKLRLWELVDYNRVLFLDADTLVLKNMDGVFSDPAGKHRKRRAIDYKKNEENEADLPETYVFGSRQEVLHTNHAIPPVPWPYFNAGFLMLSPDMKLFEYYTSLLEVEGKFDSTYPEQNLLNYAHREDGPMPWKEMNWKWNVNLPTMRDLEAGVKSLHVKGWSEGNGLQPVEKGIRDIWAKTKKELNRFWEERD